jgi:hypothetical protein
MSFRSPPRNDTTISRVESMSNEELFETSLSALSRKLSASLSSRQTFVVYLNWLEVHRQRPSKLTEHWDNTLLHWAQALRTRGFTLDRLISEVQTWVQDNRPVRSHRRSPPEPHDLAKAYPAAERIGYSYRPSVRHPQEGKFDGKLPRNYVCNRCNKKGTSFPHPRGRSE